MVAAPEAETSTVEVAVAAVGGQSPAEVAPPVAPARAGRVPVVASDRDLSMVASLKEAGAVMVLVVF